MKTARSPRLSAPRRSYSDAVRTVADHQRDCVVQFVQRTRAPARVASRRGTRQRTRRPDASGGSPNRARASDLRAASAGVNSSLDRALGMACHSARRESVQVVQPSCGLRPQGNHLLRAPEHQIPSANGAGVPGATPPAHRCSGTRTACRCPAARSHTPEASSTRRRRRRRHRQLELGALAGSTAPAVGRRGPERRSSRRDALRASATASASTDRSLSSLANCDPSSSAPRREFDATTMSTLIWRSVPSGEGVQPRRRLGL